MYCEVIGILVDSVPRTHRKEVVKMMSNADYATRPVEGFILAHLPKQGWSQNMTTDLPESH